MGPDITDAKTEATSTGVSDYEIARNADEDRRENIKAWASTISAVATLCIPIVLLLANCTIQRGSEVRASREVALQLQSQREQSEAQMKAAMFGKLLDKYQSSAGLTDPLQKIFYLELLVANFGDSLNLSPIVNDLSTPLRNPNSNSQSKIPKDVYDRVKAAIREAGSRQLSMLANVGALLDVHKITKGKPFTVLVQNCIEGRESLNEHLLTFKLVRIETRNQEPAALIDVYYWSPKWNMDNATHFHPPVRRSFFVESIDLPLIDNLPLREGVRLAIRNLKPISNGGDNAFELVAFTQEYSSIRDKPTAKEYVDYLTKGAIGKELDSKTFKCFAESAPMSIRMQPKLGPQSAEYIYQKKYML